MNEFLFATWEMIAAGSFQVTAMKVPAKEVDWDPLADIGGAIDKKLAEISAEILQIYKCQ